MVYGLKHQHFTSHSITTIHCFNEWLVVGFADADKAVQHVTPFAFPWPLGSQFSMMGLSELKAAINSENDGVASSERQRIMKWTIDDVMSHVKSLGCVDQAKVFGEEVRLLSLVSG